MINAILLVAGILLLFIIIFIDLYKINKTINELNTKILSIINRLDTKMLSIVEEFDKKIACQNFKIRKLDNQFNKSNVNKDIRKAINNKK